MMDRSPTPPGDSAPELALLCAILRQAFADCHAGGDVGSEARAWLHGPELVYWLELAGLEVEAVRERLQQCML